MKRQHEGTPGIWAVGSIVAVALLSLILSGCGGAPALPGDASGAGRDLATTGSMTGDASGVVRDMATQAPIQGATVTIGGRSDVTGVDGRYQITDITPVGVYSVTCVPPPGWTVPGTLRPVQISEGANNIDDILLSAAANQPPGPPGF